MANEQKGFDINSGNFYISKIAVSGLFEQIGNPGYTYSVEFNPRYSIMFGSNGIGKTTVFRIVECVLIEPETDDGYKEYERFLMSVPFESVMVLFNNGYRIEIKKCRTEKCPGVHATGSYQSITITTWFGEEDSVVFDEWNDNIEQKLKQYYDTINKVFANKNCLFIKVNRTIDLEELKKNISEYINNQISNKNNIINTNGFDAKFRKYTLPTVTQLFDKKIDDLAEGIKRYKRKGVKNDYVFNVAKHLYYGNDVKLSQEEMEIVNKIKGQDIEGVLKQFYGDFIKYQEYYGLFGDNNKNKIEYVGGKLQINLNRNGVLCKRGDFNVLSSGELNLATILFELIMNTNKGSIVFIDEPEISLHLAWQEQLADVIERIIDYKGEMQVIVASHSPFMSAGNEGLLVGIELQ